MAGATSRGFKVKGVTVATHAEGDLRDQKDAPYDPGLENSVRKMEAAATQSRAEGASGEEALLVGIFAAKVKQKEL